MHLTKNKLNAIMHALRVTLEKGDLELKRYDYQQALRWAEEQTRKRAEGIRSYVGAKG